MLEAVRGHALWAAGDTVTVACSGGRDSVVLLDVLVATAGAHGGRLRVLTVDHGVREGSDADAAFVEALATSHGLPCRVVRVETAPDEASMRAARHTAYADAPGWVATGHHQGDQAETVLLQLMRGAGAAGRAGMAWSGDGRVRPLLDTPPDALEAYARARGLLWREDPTNADARYLRNRVRHEVLPLLESLRPGATATLARGAHLAAADEACLAALADEGLRTARTEAGLDAAWVAGAPEAVARRGLRACWPELSSAQVDAALAMARTQDGAVTLGPRRRLVVDAGRVTVRG